MTNATKMLLATFTFAIGAGVAFDMHHEPIGGALVICAIISAFTFCGIVTS